MMRALYAISIVLPAMMITVASCANHAGGTDESVGVAQSALDGPGCYGTCTHGTPCDTSCAIYTWGNEHMGTCGEFGICDGGAPMDCWGGCNMLYTCLEPCVLYNEQGWASVSTCGNFGCCSTGCGTSEPDPEPLEVSGESTGQASCGLRNGQRVSESRCSECGCSVFGSYCYC